MGARARVGGTLERWVRLVHIWLVQIVVLEQEGSLDGIMEVVVGLD